MTFPNMNGQNLVIQLDMAGIGISFGAACASGTAKTPAILLDMGHTEADALSTVRISFGKIHSLVDVDTVVDVMHQIMIRKSKELIPHEG